MSKWAHVYFMAEATTFGSYDSKTGLKEQVEEAMEWAPRITGSEQDAEVFVLPSRQCSIISTGKARYSRWNTVYICCAGHLRDRSKEQAEADIQSLIHWMQNEFSIIRNITYKVYGDGEEGV